MLCLSDKCFNSGKIQWSPLKNLPVDESLLNGQKHDISNLFRDSSFWKLPERPHPIFICSKSTMNANANFEFYENSVKLSSVKLSKKPTSLYFQLYQLLFEKLFGKFMPVTIIYVCYS